MAVIALDATGKGDLIKPVLLRRPTLGKAIIEAIFAKRQDSLRIDIEEAESSIAALPIPRHDFLSLLSRKIQVHQWIFRSPREKAMLPIGSFLGVFSWQNANDVVVCHNILQLRTPLDPSDCLGWTRLLVTYNDLRSDRYRSLPNPAAPENKSILSQMLHSVERCYTNILKDQSVNDVSQRYTPQQYAVTMAAVEVHCERAKENFANDSLPDVVVSIEIAISAIHTLVDALTESLTIHE